jgi:predicted nuclease with TOPRIM domain
VINLFENKWRRSYQTQEESESSYEFYESEVRRLEQQLAQNNTGFNKQITELEAKVKELTESIEAKNND